MKVSKKTMRRNYKYRLLRVVSLSRPKNLPTRRTVTLYHLPDESDIYNYKTYKLDNTPLIISLINLIRRLNMPL